MTEKPPDPPREDRRDLSLGSILTSEGFAKQDEQYESEADKALMERPTFDIRTRLWLAFSLFFLYSVGTTLWAIDMLADLEQKVRFLEVAEEYTEEIQQARRFEKTFLLYGTNLEDARLHAAQARQIAVDRLAAFRAVLGDQMIATMQSDLDKYSNLLDSLVQEPSASYEEELREHGAALVRTALGVAAEERHHLNTMLTLARRIPIILLVVLAILMLVVVRYLYGQIHNTLTRFVTYTERIGAGDFTPITPARDYRDEFSTLALMINRMMRALDRQHRILSESHKLRAMGTLVAGVAHELNNPMNNMLLTASLLQEEYEALEEEDRQEMFGDLVSQAERAKNIVRNLLDFARESETHVKPIDLGSIVEQTVKLVSNQAKVKKVRIVKELPADLPMVHGDEQLVGQVFMNLILNALEVLPEGGEVRLRSDIDRREGFLAIDVTDTGPGIPEHAMSRIFDPFFTTKPKGKGTGLGLSVSRGIIRKLGGYLLAESSLGEGSTFTVLLPITTIPSEISTRSAPEAPPSDAPSPAAEDTGGELA